MPQLKNALLKICNDETSGFLGWTVDTSKHGQRKILIYNVRSIANAKDWEDEKALIAELASLLTRPFYFINGDLYDQLHEKLWNTLSSASESPWPENKHAYKTLIDAINKAQKLLHAHNRDRLKSLKHDRPLQYIRKTLSDNSYPELAIVVIKSLMETQLFTYENIVKLNNINTWKTWEMLSQLPLDQLTQEIFDFVTANTPSATNSSTLYSSSPLQSRDVPVVELTQKPI